MLKVKDVQEKYKISNTTVYNLLKSDTEFKAASVKVFGKRYFNEVALEDWYNKKFYSEKEN